MYRHMVHFSNNSDDDERLRPSNYALALVEMSYIVLKLY